MDGSAPDRSDRLPKASFYCHQWPLLTVASHFILSLVLELLALGQQFGRQQMPRWMRSCQVGGWLVGHELTGMATGHFPRAARGQNQAGKQMSASDGEMCRELSERITTKGKGERKSQDFIKKG